MSTATEVKPTPGPWHDTGETDRDGAGVYTTTIESYNRFVAIVYGNNKELCHANARLIAAAPEMLSALECAETVLLLLKDEAKALGFNAKNVLPNIQDAIRKARGAQ